MTQVTIIFHPAIIKKYDDEKYGDAAVTEEQKAEMASKKTYREAADKIRATYEHLPDPEVPLGTPHCSVCGYCKAKFFEKWPPSLQQDFWTCPVLGCTTTFCGLKGCSKSQAMAHKKFAHPGSGNLQDYPTAIPPQLGSTNFNFTPSAPVNYANMTPPQHTDTPAVSCKKETQHQRALIPCGVGECPYASNDSSNLRRHRRAKHPPQRALVPGGEPGPQSGATELAAALQLSSDVNAARRDERATSPTTPSHGTQRKQPRQLVVPVLPSPRRMSSRTSKKSARKLESDAGIRTAKRRRVKSLKFVNSKIQSEVSPPSSNVLFSFDIKYGKQHTHNELEDTVSRRIIYSDGDENDGASSNKSKQLICSVCSLPTGTGKPCRVPKTSDGLKLGGACCGALLCRNRGCRQQHAAVHQ